MTMHLWDKKARVPATFKSATTPEPELFPNQPTEEAIAGKRRTHNILIIYDDMSQRS